MLEVNKEQSEKLQSLVDAGVAPDLASALDICVDALWQAYQPDEDLSEDEISILKERVVAARRGEGVAFESGEALLSEIQADYARHKIAIEA